MLRVVWAQLVPDIPRYSCGLHQQPAARSWSRFLFYLMSDFPKFYLICRFVVDFNDYFSIILSPFLVLTLLYCWLNHEF